MIATVAAWTAVAALAMIVAWLIAHVSWLLTEIEQMHRDHMHDRMVLYDAVRRLKELEREPSRAFGDER